MSSVLSAALFATSICALPFIKNRTDKLHWGNIADASLAFTVAHAALSHASLTVLVTEDTPQALKLETELQYLTAHQQLEVLTLPDWETLPYDHFSPHQDIISQRLTTLYRLPNLKRGILIVPVSTLMQRVAPADFLDSYSLLVKVGDKLDLHQMRQRLERAGYNAVDKVMEHGEFSARGSLLDLYPMGSTVPYRIDFFDDEVDGIRIFNPENQRSEQQVSEIALLPAHEFPTDDSAIERFRSQYRTLFGASNAAESVYQQVSKKLWPAGIEYYQPLFFNELAELFSYLPENSVLLSLAGYQQHAEKFWQDVQYRFENRGVDPMRPLPAPASMYLSVDELNRSLNGFARINLHRAELPASAAKHNAQYLALPECQIQHQLKVPFAQLQQAILAVKAQSGRVLLSVESEGRRETLQTLLRKSGLQPVNVNDFTEFCQQGADFSLMVSPFDHGLYGQWQNKPWLLLTEAELLGVKVSQKRRRRHKGAAASADAIIRNLAELSIGNPVVHIDHGVGRYMGLQTLDTGGLTTEFVTLVYADDAKLYVPVASLHLLSRYSGSDIDQAPLNRLGSEQWEKAKRKAAEKVRDVAAELLDVYAKRASKFGFSYRVEEADYQQFVDSFPFEETEDQANAIKAVLRDMHSPVTMDRLVCGDVGFGKTEVAMRAAFAAVHNGKQVAVLVPTTLLAQQHFENFVDRFAKWPVKVAVLSRFKTAKEQTAIIEQVSQGQVDILIGTHKLLQGGIQFKDLGLLIIDEEHRFGVRQKEQIKKLRTDVDILTLTATPIPRTLNMAMNNIRDLSIIATPPARRLAVKTFVQQSDDNVIKEAILREIKRGGQVYYLHNDVASIEKTAEHIRQLLPDARVVVAHGQMRERELEQIMADFYHQRFNVLVCTTIIETGIDVPSANTIIIDRADHLGLAQLHQLRGRVGRSHHQAYAYLLTPPPKLMTKDAEKRLEAIASLEDLGAGFALATHDLEIRGAGELLGEEQSGQIAAIGFSLYTEMLEQAVDALRNGKQPSLDTLLRKQAEVDLKIPALLPADYIPDVNTRLSQYKAIASCQTEQELDEVQIDLIDRFGLLPDAGKNLLRQQAFRLRAQLLGIKKIEYNGKSGFLDFEQDTKVDLNFIIGLLQTQPRVYKMEGPNRLKFAIDSSSNEQRLQLVDNMLEQFAQKLSS